MFFHIFYGTFCLENYSANVFSCKCLPKIFFTVMSKCSSTTEILRIQIWRAIFLLWLVSNIDIFVNTNVILLRVVIEVTIYLIFNVTNTMKGLQILIFSGILVDILGNELKNPSIFVSILIRNKAHILPYFLSNFENLDYPKDRISLW